MNGKYKSGIIAFIAVMVWCTPLSDEYWRSISLPHPGMKKIASAGESFTQGWNNTLASYDERPGMTSSFSYDYWLDTTEVTQKLFYEVTGKLPVAAGSLYGAGDNYPVYMVSWFDAVLFCNARSRREGLDTVYRYSGLKTSQHNIVYDLTGLSYDMTRDGYRLPTEAEWEFAARGASSFLPYCSWEETPDALSEAWFVDNSSNTTHEVATKEPNALGLYDMAGNVFEWTNDWKGMYDGTSITNPLGQSHPDNEYEKVIKGGSFNYSLMYLRPSHRSAVYASMLSSATEYIGFRCARGPVDNGRYFGMSQTPFIPNPVTIDVGAGDLQSFIGTSEVKAVFVNVTGSNRTLCYVDFSGMYPRFQEYLDDRNVYAPTISPDGRYAAYCGNNEGQAGPSKVSIRSLDSRNTPIVRLGPDTAYMPRWLVDPLTGDTCIVYTNSGVDNEHPLWLATKTFLQKMSGGTPAGGPQELVGNGSYHGGLSSDRQLLVTGYRRLLTRGVMTGEVRQLFLYPQNGKDPGGSTQVCNVSISPDTGSGVRCMFLDFGYQQTSMVTGCSYGIHQFLFVSSMDGTVTDFIRCPFDDQRWDYPEWTNKPWFAVACGRNGADLAHAIYAIDLEFQSSKPIIMGTELQQPYLWIGFLIPNTYGFEPDSIGRYNDPPTDIWHADMATHLLLWWRLVDSLEIAIVGSSHAQIDVNPQRISGFTSFNLGAAAGDLLWERHCILDYLLKQCPRLELICASLDMGWWANPEGDYWWSQGIGKSSGYKYDSAHLFWSGGATADFKTVIRKVPLSLPWVETLQSGYYYQNACDGWGDSLPPYTGGPDWTTADTHYQKNLAAVTAMADTLRARGIHLLMVSFPVSPHYRNTDHYRTCGPTRQTAAAVLQQLRSLEGSNPFFHLYDANRDGGHDYRDDEAADIDHLCRIGADRLTDSLNVLIHSILGR
ncbi:MAG: SUMF1/EgtB/PvdO family nonheme iron enzyme [Chitinispirillaceae bacterium]|nr:SUMF1/EgtB/PvdO family nonheme iron enzyme [Chitinispirillaceae bacterium]